MKLNLLKNNLFLKNKVTVYTLVLSILLNIILILIVYFKMEPRAEPIALRYSIYLGIDLIGSWWHIFIFPLIGLAIIITNFFLAYLIYIKIKILSYFLMLSAAISQLVLIIISILIILLNQ